MYVSIRLSVSNLPLYTSNLNCSLRWNKIIKSVQSSASKEESLGVVWLDALELKELFEAGVVFWVLVLHEVEQSSEGSHE